MRLLKIYTARGKLMQMCSWPQPAGIFRKKMIRATGPGSFNKSAQVHRLIHQYFMFGVRFREFALYFIACGSIGIEIHAETGASLG